MKLEECILEEKRDKLIKRINFNIMEEDLNLDENDLKDLVMIGFIIVE